MTCVCLYASSLLDKTRDMRDNLSFVRRISIGEIGMPGADKTLKEHMREVAFINSISFMMASEDCGTSKLLSNSVITPPRTIFYLRTIRMQASGLQIYNFPSLHCRRIPANKPNRQLQQLHRVVLACGDGHATLFLRYQNLREMITTRENRSEALLTSSAKQPAKEDTGDFRLCQ